MGNINLSDALPEDKALLDGWTTALINARFTAEKGQANGVAPLDASSLIPEAYIPASALSTVWGGITGTLSDQTDLWNLLAAKASTASPAFSGVPTVPTADLQDGSLQIANTKWVKDVMEGLGWSELGGMTASDAGSGDNYGHSVSVSGDGTVLAVGAFEWDGTVSNQGLVYIYDWDGDSWVERTKLIAPGTIAADFFGYSVALNSTGTILAVGATYEDTGGLTNNGVVHVFDWSGSAWVHRNTLEAPDKASYDYFGGSLALSSDGSVMIIGAYYWEGAAQNQGAVYTYDWSGSAWVQRGSILTASDAGADDAFGQSVSLSDDGSVLAVGAPLWDVSYDEGQVYIYDVNGTAWTERDKIKAPDAHDGDRFGFSVGLSGDGTKLAVGAPRDNEDDNLGEDEGSVYFYTWNGYDWTFNNKIIASDGSLYNEFGSSVSFTSDGKLLVVGSEFWQDPGYQGKVYYGFTH